MSRRVKTKRARNRRLARHRIAREKAAAAFTEAALRRDDPGALPWITIYSGYADIHRVDAIGQTDAGWVLDAYAGYWVEVLDGPAKGQARLIVGNTRDTVTLIRLWTVDPGRGAAFHVVKPDMSYAHSSLQNTLFFT